MFSAHLDSSAPLLSVFQRKPVAGMLEMGAYERMWLEATASFRTIADVFREHPESLPSDHIDPDVSRATARKVVDRLAARGVEKFGVRVNGAGEYPDRLRHAAEPVELLYYQGDWGLASSPKSIAIVGTRQASAEGAARTRRLVKLLVNEDFTIVSGLAKGIDTAALSTAIDMDGRAIAVIGTPLGDFYPRENRELQETIARDHLLVSQVPVLRYAAQDYRRNRLFFPERNKTMSAMTDATVIVEAGETSGTLIQATAALHQGRKLFILDSCFANKSITWPARFESQGAIRVREFAQITEALRTSA